MAILFDMEEAAPVKAEQKPLTLDTSTSEALERVTRLASRIFGVSTVLITCAENEHRSLMSYLGIDAAHLARIGGLCWHNVESDDVVVIENASLHEHFRNDPLVIGEPNIRFYAAAPLTTADGLCIGSLCILDKKPKALSGPDRQLLKDLASIVMEEITFQYAIGRVEPVTMLPNRTQFMDDYTFMCHESICTDYTIIAFDISLLQLVTVARAIGSNYIEQIIRETADRIQSEIGLGTVLYQIGPSTFACLIPGEYHDPVCDSLSDIVTKIREPVACGAIPISIPACAGVARFRLGQSDPFDILRMAYNAVYNAREDEAPWRHFNEKQDQLYKRSFRLLSDASKALETLSEFRLVFQPRLNIGSGKCVGVEALLRWHHPRLGAISPAEFIPLIEGTDLVRPVTEWVLDRGMAQARLWQKSGMDLRVSVNLSGRNLDEVDFVERLQAKMDVHGLAPEFLELEFTESALPRNGTRAVERLNRIRNMGVEIAIDDFGTGYSNLSHLQRLPAQILKIDQSLVRFLTTNQRDQTIVRSTMAMAHELGYRVVIEGVEDKETRSLIASWGCDEAQGYFFAKPLSPEALLTWIEAPGMGLQSSFV